MNFLFLSLVAGNTFALPKFKKGCSYDASHTFGYI